MCFLFKKLIVQNNKNNKEYLAETSLQWKLVPLNLPGMQHYFKPKSNCDLLFWFLRLTKLQVIRYIRYILNINTWIYVYYRKNVFLDYFGILRYKNKFKVFISIINKWFWGDFIAHKKTIIKERKKIIMHHYSTNWHF